MAPLNLPSVLIIFMLFTSSIASDPVCVSCSGTTPSGIIPKPKAKSKELHGNPPGTGSGIIPPLILAPPPKAGCNSPPLPPKDTCPFDALKLGACVDVLGGLVHIGVGDPVVNTCCSVIQGLAELEAAICLCTTLKLKLLNVKIYIPIAIQVLAACNKLPPGFNCPI